ncbi:hypothetical protein JK635_01945 [Neobacillus sp. YIM B02564]|uniref:Uncharacterized protein n=2 Tax=Neobacillus paridis TaxID=2803862 RepID=A0ABS1TI63_9BACI|nr:hypothetical protein [Neobacillus paridis]
MPTRPDDVNKIISKYIKAKTPHFFIYAKDKKKENVEPLNDSVVNNLEDIIPKKRINFVKIAGKFNYRMLMSGNVERIDKNIIQKYKELDRNKKWISNKLDDNSTNKKIYIYKFIREELSSLQFDESRIVDILVEYLYGRKNSSFKETLWWVYGDILLSNLRENLKETKQCECCGIRIKIINNQSKYCENCFNRRRKEYKRKKEKMYRMKKRGQLEGS